MSDFSLLVCSGCARTSCRAGGDGSSGCSLPVRGHPDSPRVAAAAGRGRRGDATGAERQPAQPAGLPLALPLQTRHQPQDQPHVSHMRISSFCCCRGAISYLLIVGSTEIRGGVFSSTWMFSNRIFVQTALSFNLRSRRRRFIQLSLLESEN